MIPGQDFGVQQRCILCLWISHVIVIQYTPIPNHTSIHKYKWQFAGKQLETEVYWIDIYMSINKEEKTRTVSITGLANPPNQSLLLKMCEQYVHR